MRIGGRVRLPVAFPCHVTKRILVFQHSPGRILGVLEPPLLDGRLRAHTWRTFEEPAPPLHAGEISGLIGLGGIMHPDKDVVYPWLPEVRALYRQAVAREIPTLGVCLGMQLMSQALGGSAGPLGRLRVGFLPVEFQAGDDPLFGGLPDTLRPLSWHEYVAIPPPDATVLAAADGTPQAIRFHRSRGACSSTPSSRATSTCGSRRAATRSAPAASTWRRSSTSCRRWSTRGSRTARSSPVGSPGWRPACRSSPDEGR